MKLKLATRRTRCCMGMMTPHNFYIDAWRGRWRSFLFSSPFVAHHSVEFRTSIYWRKSGRCVSVNRVSMCLPSLPRKSIASFLSCTCMNKLESCMWLKKKKKDVIVNFKDYLKLLYQQKCMALKWFISSGIVKSLIRDEREK